MIFPFSVPACFTWINTEKLFSLGRKEPENGWLVSVLKGGVSAFVFSDIICGLFSKLFIY